MLLNDNYATSRTIVNFICFYGHVNFKELLMDFDSFKNSLNLPVGLLNLASPARYKNTEGQWYWYYISLIIKYLFHKMGD